MNAAPLETATLLKSGEITEQDIEKFAALLQQRGLSDLALFLIEAHLPLAGMFSNLCLIAVSYTHLTLPTNREV